MVLLSFSDLQRYEFRIEPKGRSPPRYSLAARRRASVA